MTRAAWRGRAPQPAIRIATEVKGLSPLPQPSEKLIK